jgi:hypothetical protein
MKLAKVAVAAGLFALAGCSGIRESNGTFVAHAESFRIIGFAIPADDQQAAMNLVPPGAKIESVSASAADWTSFWGFFGNLFWFHMTQIGGTK